MNKKLVKWIFYIMMGIFVLLVSYFAAPAPHEAKRVFFPAVTVLGILFFLLGIALIIATIKSKIKGKQKLFLLLTGGSAAGAAVSVLLHNFVYALFIILFGQNFWDNIGVPDEPIFFIIALIVCPIAFLIGVIGTIIMFAKKKH